MDKAKRVVIEHTVGDGVAHVEFLLQPMVRVSRERTFKVDGETKELLRASDPPFLIGNYVDEKLAMDMLLFNPGTKIISEEEVEE